MNQGEHAISESSRGKLAHKMMPFLFDAIQSWTIKDIMNDDLNEKKVKPIPLKFESAQQFFDIHSEHLIEEVRATLKEAVLDIRKTQILYVSSAQEIGVSALFLDIDLKKARSNADECCHIAHDLDIFLLSCESPLASNFTVQSCCLGMAMDVGQDTYYQRSFKVLLSSKNKIPPEKLKCVTFLTNMSTKMKISNALSFDDRKNDAIEAILALEKTINKKCGNCDKFGSLAKDTPEDLQTRASIVSTVICNHQRQAKIIWTPPGSGHDPLICHITKSLVNRGDRVLICLPTAAAIWDFLKNLDEPSNFGDVLVLNSSSDLENNKTFGKASLEKRSHELYCCLIVWKSWMKEVRRLLDLIGFCYGCCPRPDKCTLLHFSLKSFLERFDNIVGLLKGCLEMVKKLSIICLPDCDASNANKLLDTLCQLDHQLHSHGLADETVQAAFDPFGISFDIIDDGTEKKLNAAKIDCLKLIDILVASLKLPQLDSREEVDQFCIIHSRFIISTPDYASQMHGVKMKPFQVMIVGHAGLINESELLIPLNLPLVHAVLLGDHKRQQPAIKSKLCQEAGYGRSLFQRFLLLSSKICMLKEQHTMDPLVSQFPNKFVYGRRIVNSEHVESPEYNMKFRKTRYPQYAFLEIPVMNNPGHVESKNSAQSAAIMALLESLYADINVSVGINIGVICLSINDANAVRSQLTSKHKLRNDNIKLEVKSVDSLQLDWFDLTILSTLVQDYTDLQLVKDTSMNVALTCSRHLCWIVGRSTDLLSIEGTWSKLISDARERDVIKKLDGKLFREAVKKLEMNDEDSCIDKSAFEKENLCKIGQEITWVGRPHNTKFILSHVRDQKGDCDSCTVQTCAGTVESINKHQHASLEPPQDFNWKLSTKDFKDQYHKKVGRKVSEEDDIKLKGNKRLTTHLDILIEHGVKGSNGVESEDRIFKISSYELLEDLLEANDIRTIMAYLMKGHIMPCHFRLSRNYFYLQPGEVYQYDKKHPYIHPKSGLPVSHAVMMVGGGKLPLPDAVHGTPQSLVHSITQNSEGETFGFGGIGKVSTDSLRGIYHVRI